VFFIGEKDSDFMSILGRFKQIVAGDSSLQMYLAGMALIWLCF